MLICAKFWSIYCKTCISEYSKWLPPVAFWQLLSAPDSFSAGALPRSPRGGSLQHSLRPSSWHLDPIRRGALSSNSPSNAITLTSHSVYLVLVSKPLATISLTIRCLSFTSHRLWQLYHLWQFSWLFRLASDAADSFGSKIKCGNEAPCTYRWFNLATDACRPRVTSQRSCSNWLGVSVSAAGALVTGLIHLHQGVCCDMGIVYQTKCLSHQMLYHITQLIVSTSSCQVLMSIE